MTLVIIVYILLLIIFLVISGLIFRHAVKFGYLSPRFKIVVTIFGIISLIIIIFSVYLMFQTNKSGGSGYEYYDTKIETIPTRGLSF